MKKHDQSEVLMDHFCMFIALWNLETINQMGSDLGSLSNPRLICEGILSVKLDLALW